MKSTSDRQQYKREMTLKDNYPSKRFESLLIKEGFIFKNQEGSHRTFKNEKTGIVVCYPYGKIIAVGTLRKELKKVFPLWNKTEETTEETTGTQESKYALTPDMLALCKELGYNESELTQDDYNSLVELTNEVLS